MSRICDVTVPEERVVHEVLVISGVQHVIPRREQVFWLVPHLPTIPVQHNYVTHSELSA